jgi:hypothetical protein
MPRCVCLTLVRGPAVLCMVGGRAKVTCLRLLPSPGLMIARLWGVQAMRLGFRKGAREEGRTVCEIGSSKEWKQQAAGIVAWFLRCVRLAMGSRSQGPDTFVSGRSQSGGAKEKKAEETRKHKRKGLGGGGPGGGAQEERLPERQRNARNKACPSGTRAASKPRSTW